ncbi:MAG TPA: efflux RND transporter permease subunit [Gammaproteobacteria bacterium]
MFRTLVSASLTHRLYVLTVCVVLLCYGALNLDELRIDVLPDLNKPTVTVMTETPGMAPEEVEQLVTYPLEAAMNGLPGVKRVRSVSGMGLSIVFAEFDWGSDVYRNRQQVAERIAVVRDQLPPGILPQIGPIASIMGEVMLISLSSEDASVSAMQLRELADWDLRPHLLTLPGVSQVTTIGGEVRQYAIQPDVVAMDRLDVTLDAIEQAVRGYSANAGGGFVEHQGQEYVVRHLGRSVRLENLRDLVVSHASGQPVLLGQVAKVGFYAQVKRGDAGVNGREAVILSVQKQPDADTLRITRELETALERMQEQLPDGARLQILFKQADFIGNAIDNLQVALRHAAIIVAVVLFLFLLNLRTTVISLVAIPVSMLITVLVFRYLGLSINTMTLGGIAIAIGELVDDAVVDVENVFRRLRQQRPQAGTREALRVVLDASLEVRSGVVNATFVIVLVFVPLFALPGVEGRLFASLGVAYITAILASLLVAVTLTPVLCYYLLPRIAGARGTDSPLLARLKHLETRLLVWSFAHSRTIFATAGLAVVLAVACVPLFARVFLPAFNEGTLTVNVIMQPGTALSASNEIGRMAERMLLEVPEVKHVGRRSGRAEMDEHAEGVHYSELDVALERGGRTLEEIARDVRARLAVLPAQISLGQPISHRLDHLLSGVRAQLSIKIFGDDLDSLRTLAGDLRERLARIPGLVDVQVEKQVRVPQLQIDVDYDLTRQYGVTPAAIITAMESLTKGRVVSHVISDNRRFEVVIRLDSADRSPQSLAEVLVETPGGSVPLQRVAHIRIADGLNQINHENGKRRLVVSANTDGRDMAAMLEQVRAELAATDFPQGVAVAIEGQLTQREESTRIIAWLALVSLVFIVVVIYSRYRSLALSLMVLINIPIALVGSVVALAVAGQPLSLASLIGFVTLTGIVTRNGILKISHYVNLAAHEGEVFGRDMIIRGALERIAPVLMTALSAALALLPIIWSGGGEPGKEILYPVAVVIFGGLICATLLDMVLTPVLFHRFGKQPLARLLEAAGTAQRY